MIRFLPDTWRDALLRPIAMAAPDGHVYVEIMAPDLRFVFILLLIATLAVFLLWRRRGPVPVKPVALLLGGTALAFFPWMLTTGNGRYFIPFLLLAGPLCMALVYLLPTTRGFRLAIAACLLALQAITVHDANPLEYWGLAQWTAAPYFQVDVPADMQLQPGSYVTITSISYSLIAPLFAPGSRWMNIASAPSDPAASLGGHRATAFLAAGAPLTLLAPSIPGHSTAQGLPDDESVRAINVLLAEHRLAIASPDQCRFLRSRGLVSGSKHGYNDAETPRLEKAGFWACPLRYPMAEVVYRPEIAKSRFDAVFERVEALCPRFFGPGGAKTYVINGGETRHYDSDMKLYVLDDGAVMYKYWRAYSPQLIGTVEDVMGGKSTLDCSKIRGRSGLPWERSI